MIVATGHTTNTTAATLFVVAVVGACIIGALIVGYYSHPERKERT